MALMRHTTAGQYAGQHLLLEDNMDPAYISALAALAGATIGGLTSFATSWLTQRTQLRHAHREAERAELKTLYQDFITDASRLYVQAMTTKTGDIDDISGLEGLHAMVGRMRLVSDQPVIDAAMQAEKTIIEAYLGPDRAIRELMEYTRDRVETSFLVDFSAACRKDLAARATAIR
jgi:hypothetical protein